MIKKISTNEDVTSFLKRDEIVNTSILNFLRTHKTSVVLIYNDDIENGVIAANDEMNYFFLSNV